MTRPPLLLPRELSVVVQGPILPEVTRLGLESIRTHLPGAQIVLSTWEGADLRGLSHDDLVLSEDPGPIETKSSKGANLNRLLWSTRQGLQKVDRPYCLKFRTDLRLSGPGILPYFGLFSGYLPDYKIFQERVVISTVVTWRTTRQPSGRFHPSDMFGLGRTEDIRRWWCAPLFPFPQRARFESEPVAITVDRDGVPLDEMASEQYIWLSSLQRTRPMAFKTNPTPDDFREDLLLLLNNFTVVDAKKAGIEWRKPQEIPFGYEAPLMGFSEYRFLYRRMIESRRFQVPPLEIAGKLLQLQMRKWTPDIFKALWRAGKKIGKSRA